MVQSTEFQLLITNFRIFLQSKVEALMEALMEVLMEALTSKSNTASCSHGFHSKRCHQSKVEAQVVETTSTFKSNTDGCSHFKTSHGLRVEMESTSKNNTTSSVLRLFQSLLPQLLMSLQLP